MIVFSLALFTLTKREKKEDFGDYCSGFLFTEFLLTNA
jgi:hypothetical protein